METLKAIDTNVVIRLITEDDGAQLRQARGLLNQAVVSGSALILPLSVLMEVEWVLRSAFAWRRQLIVVAISNFLRLDGIIAANPEGLDWVLDRYADGADFADMIHLLEASRLDADAFVTFDARLGEKAGGSAPLQVETVG